ncbi:hypothetical protein B0H12DRAFT_1325188 [Mycena haematopus]|nr:hypothetical protein B0H12DRAFT_1325188 [Mycena haematopus]
MVLTRRAARANNSIIRWLPNEILAAVMWYLPKLDLVALCATSRLIRNIATPLLYRAVFLSTVPQITLFIRSMTRRSGVSLSRHVRRLSITNEDVDLSLELPPTLVKAITSVLSRLCHLEVLDLLLVNGGETTEFTDMLHHSYFPKLSTFQYTIQSPTSTTLAVFLNRHPTIVDLTLTQYDRLNALDRIVLPNLKVYTGASSFIPSFNFDSTRITSVFLLWFPHDGDVETPLIQLGTMASLQTVNIFYAYDELKESDLLGSVVAYLSHVHTVKFRKMGGTAALISREDVLDIATFLERFSSLDTLDLHETLDRHETDVSGLKSVTLWGGACKSLSWIRLSGIHWKRVNGHWEVFG